MSTKPTDIFHAVRELAQKWREFAKTRPATSGFGTREAIMECAAELLALADRAEAESQREGREDRFTTQGGVELIIRALENADCSCDDHMSCDKCAALILCKHPDFMRLLATPSHPQREGQQGQYPLDFVDAWNVAHKRKDESNLARCYIHLAKSPETRT